MFTEACRRALFTLSGTLENMRHMQTAGTRLKPRPRLKAALYVRPASSFASYIMTFQCFAISVSTVQSLTM